MFQMTWAFQSPLAHRLPLPAVLASSVLAFIDWFYVGVRFVSAANRINNDTLCQYRIIELAQDILQVRHAGPRIQEPAAPEKAQPLLNSGDNRVQAVEDRKHQIAVSCRQSAHGNILPYIEPYNLYCTCLGISGVLLIPYLTKSGWHRAKNQHIH